MTPVVLVHGFGYSLRSKANSPTPLFQTWAGYLPGFPVHPFAWDSAAPPWGHVRAASRGYWNSYAYAYRRLAVEASHRLSGHIGDVGNCTILSHSLGSRVALLALHGLSWRNVQRVLILNGAEAVRFAVSTARARPGIEFHNVVVEDDAVLDLLAENFTPGRRRARAIGHCGIDEDLPNWHDISLLGSHGHFDSYERPEHWERWREVLSG